MAPSSVTTEHRRQRSECLFYCPVPDVEDGRLPRTAPMSIAASMPFAREAKTPRGLPWLTPERGVA